MCQNAVTLTRVSAILFVDDADDGYWYRTKRQMGSSHPYLPNN